MKVYKYFFGSKLFCESNAPVQINKVLFPSVREVVEGVEEIKKDVKEKKGRKKVEEPPVEVVEQVDDSGGVRKVNLSEEE